MNSLTKFLMGGFLAAFAAQAAAADTIRIGSSPLAAGVTRGAPIETSS